jgi:acyl-CoA thioester hydrolase
MFSDEHASPEFRLQTRATAPDIDELDHVSNIAYLRWIQDVAAAHSAAVGLALAQYQRIGGIFVVRKHEIEYLLPALLDDQIELRTWVSDFRGATSRRQTRVVRMRDGALLARAATLWAYLARDSGRPVRIPPPVQAAFAGPPAD